ncbi:PEP-CTERM motif protein [compost metagenome]
MLQLPQRVAKVAVRARVARAVRRATDINDNGEITAWVCDGANAQCFGALLSPVPEPATYGMLLAGLGLAVFRPRRWYAACLRKT